jgi:threonine aldolase
VSPLVDLRSDTVTQPTPAMRRAMAEAEVGDDGYREDPTVIELEATFADRVGMEAALYVPSGTMANQLALRVLAPAGTSVLVGRRQHLFAYENGAGARNSGTQLTALEDDSGQIDPAAIAWAKEGARHHLPAVGMVAVENTHMASGGRVLTPEAMKALVSAAGDLPLYVDGARIFNAEVASGVPAAELVSGATAMMACLSKGLCAPVGSVLAGEGELIEQARLERSRLGGSMRQAGVIAAAGLVALRTMVDRLAEDHARSLRLAEVVAERWPDCGLRPDNVVTNCVVFGHSDTDRLLGHLREAGVLAGTISPGVMRFMTHHDVDDTGLERAVTAIADAPR